MATQYVSTTGVTTNTTNTTTGVEVIHSTIGPNIESTVGSNGQRIGGNNRFVIQINIITKIVVILVQLRRYSSDSNTTQSLICGHFKTFQTQTT